MSPGGGGVTSASLACTFLRRSAAVAAAAEKLPGVRQKRRLADAARDEGDAIHAFQVRKTVAQRAPRLDAISRPQRG